MPLQNSKIYHLGKAEAIVPFLARAVDAAVEIQPYLVVLPGREADSVVVLSFAQIHVSHLGEMCRQIQRGSPLTAGRQRT